MQKLVMSLSLLQNSNYHLTSAPMLPKILTEDVIMTDSWDNSSGILLNHDPEPSLMLSDLTYFLTLQVLALHQRDKTPHWPWSSSYKKYRNDSQEKVQAIWAKAWQSWCVFYWLFPSLTYHTSSSGSLASPPAYTVWIHLLPFPFSTFTSPVFYAINYSSTLIEWGYLQGGSGLCCLLAL